MNDKTIDILEGLIERWMLDADYLRRHAKDSEREQIVIGKCVKELQQVVERLKSG
jgi:hypothetical protein